jgi:hypothetical protein
MRLALVMILVSGGSALGHVALEQPASRYGPDVLKFAPCGRPDGTRSGNVTTFVPGATIEVVFSEYIDHPGHFRVAFDPDGDDDFRDPPCLENCQLRDDPPPVFGFYSDPSVLLDAITDARGGTTRVTITLPDIECERCTLQVIQVMYDKRPITSPGDDIYDQCADLVLARGGDAGPVDDAGAGAEAEPEATAESVAEGDAPSDGGCSGGGPAGLVALACWLAWRRARAVSLG